MGKGIGDARGREDTDSQEPRIDSWKGQDRSDSRIHWRVAAGDYETTEGAWGGKWLVLDQSGLYNESEASLGYTARSCLKIITIKKKMF